MVVDEIEKFKQVLDDYFTPISDDKLSRNELYEQLRRVKASAAAREASLQAQLNVQVQARRRAELMRAESEEARLRILNRPALDMKLACVDAGNAAQVGSAVQAGTSEEEAIMLD